MKHRYCNVLVKGMDRPYYFISDFGKLKPGTFVAVPFGPGNTCMVGIVESCASYRKSNAPYPVEQTKHIFGLTTLDEYERSEAFPSWAESEALANLQDALEVEDWEEVLAWAMELECSEDEQILLQVARAYRLCIEAELPKAAERLGLLYLQGHGVSKNYTLAAQYLQTAADAGEVEALRALGECAYFGKGREVDAALAYRCFALGALLRLDTHCLVRLGDMYFVGDYVAENKTLAYSLYDLAQAETELQSHA